MFTKIGEPPRIDTNNWKSNASLTIGSGAAKPGNTGRIEIIADSIKLDQGNILATTQGGESGNIDLKVKDILLLDNNSLISTRANRDANGGKIFVTSPKIEILNNSSISANNLGSGRGGDITLNVDSLNLSDRGSISTQTNSNRGGDINFQNTDLILMRRGSQISTNAGTAGASGDGGNITINEKNNPKGLIVAFPNENNDITANAFTGAGGRLEINSLGLFGIQPLSRKELVDTLKPKEPNELDPQKLPSNDITAISQQNPNLQEQVNINTEIDPSRGLIDLTQTVTDPEDQIAQNPCTKGRDSEFYITGRGGIVPKPYDIISPDGVEVGLVDPVSEGGEAEVQRGGGDEEKSEVASVPPELPPPAQGWIFTEDGKVMLTSYDPTGVGGVRSRQNSNTCPAP